MNRPITTNRFSQSAIDFMDFASRDLPRFIAIPGGRSARALFSQLAKAPNPKLASIHFFFTDERAVAPTDRESNFRLAQETLFEPLAIAPANIHRIRGELEADAAVAEANAEILRVVPKGPDGHPTLDLVILGMGEDGHIASLFPNEPESVIENQNPYLWVTNSPKPPPNRVTLSYAAILGAKQIWALALGSGKEQALRESLSPAASTPLGRVLSARRDVKIYTDLSAYETSP